MENTSQHSKLEMLLWSIALPGFGQLAMGRYLKGLLFVGLEVLINVMAGLNKVIILSFQGNILESIQVTNYQWLMFYPCLYLFAIWDAYKQAGGNNIPFAYIPFVSTAYFMTIGVVYSSVFTIQGNLLGPIWLPILFIPVGILFGTIVRYVLLKFPRFSVIK